MTRAVDEGGSSDPGPTLISADPATLMAFAADIRSSALGASEELTGYNQSLTALADQPIDPGYTFPPNRLFEVAGVFQGLESTCFQAKGFAAALRQLDANMDGQLDALDNLTPAMVDLFLRARAGNPKFTIDQVDLPALLCELASQQGLDTDPDIVRDQLQQLLDDDLIAYPDFENPLLVSYLIERGMSGILDVSDEVRTLDISVDDDGSLKGLGMDDWDPATLAAIQHALDDHSRLERSRWLAAEREAGHIPDISAGQYANPEFMEMERNQMRQSREDWARYLLDKLRDEGDRGFYSSDLYDDLLDDYESMKTDRFDEAFLLALTQSGLHGPTPIYDMTRWDKFKGGVDVAADVAVWVGTGALLIPGGQIPGAIIRGAGGVVLLGTAVDITDACAINDDKSNCVQEIGLATIDGVTAGKIKAIRKYFLSDGPLTASEKRILRGLEASASVSGSTLDTITDGDPTYEVDSHTIRPGSRN